MLTAHLHRCGAKPVAGEDTGHCRTFVEQEHRQVLATYLADTGLRHTDANTGNTMDISR